MFSLSCFLRLLRVNQWIKNLLIFFPLIFAGKIKDQDLVLSTFIVFVCFSLLASSVYVLNDLVDVKEDRLHEKKKKRPIASGEISYSLACIIGFGMLAVSFLGAWFFLPTTVIFLFFFYLVANFAYSLFFKVHPPLDIITVSLFYLLRPAVGAEAINVPVSNWLILTTFFAALYLVSLKRYAELFYSNGQVKTRKGLEFYSLTSLQGIGNIALASAFVSYGIYAAAFPHSFILTIIPLTALGLRFVILAERKTKIFENPESIIFKDKTALTLIVTWLLMVVYYHW